MGPSLHRLSSIIAASREGEQVGGMEAEEAGLAVEVQGLQEEDTLWQVEAQARRH